MEKQNSNTIFEAYTNQKSKFCEIENQAKKCKDTTDAMANIRHECISLYKQVFTKFCSKREKLGLYVRGSGYGTEDKNPYTGWKTTVDKENRYGWKELCLNTMGFSLLPTYGEKSDSIFNMPDKEIVLFFMSLTEPIVMDKLKDLLSEEKLNLLTRAITNIRDITYCNYIERKKGYDFTTTNKESSSMEKNRCKGDDITITTASGYCYILFGLNTRINTWNTNEKEINILDISLYDKIAVEQTIEEITYMLSEYRKELVIQEKKHSDYLNKLKEEFTNELIIMSLIK